MERLNGDNDKISVRDSMHYTDDKVNLLKESINIRLDALDKATALAASNLEKKLESMDVDGKFLPRTEFNVAHDKLLEDVKEARENMVSRVQHDSLSKEVNGLQQSFAKMEGKASQDSVNKVSNFTLIGIVIAIISVIISIILHFV